MAYRRSCIFPSNQAAAIGSPSGLTRNAITKRMIPFCTDQVRSTDSPNRPTMVPAKPKIKAEQYRMPEQIQTKSVSVRMIGAIKTFKTTFIGRTSLSVKAFLTLFVL